MIRSMTGYARTERATPLGSLTCELRAVNHKFLELQLKLPDAFKALEGSLRQATATRLGRGRVEATIGLRSAESAANVGRLNLPLARQLIAHAAVVSNEIPDAAPLAPIEVLRWPGVLESPQTNFDAIHPDAQALFEAALIELAEARAREGVRIGEMLERRLAEIEALVTAVHARLPAVLAKIRERLRERVQSLGVTVDPERLEQELVLIAQKMDVAEELDRLGSHIAEFRATIRSDVPVGRKLDFLVQELNREANTLASKSADTDTTRQAVDIKVLIEQIREQVQNVE